MKKTLSIIFVSFLALLFTTTVSAAQYCPAPGQNAAGFTSANTNGLQLHNVDITMNQTKVVCDYHGGNGAVSKILMGSGFSPAGNNWGAYGSRYQCVSSNPTDCPFN